MEEDFSVAKRNVFWLVTQKFMLNLSTVCESHEGSMCIGK